MVDLVGLELLTGVDNTQVIDFYVCQKAQKARVSTAGYILGTVNFSRTSESSQRFDHLDVNRRYAPQAGAALESNKMGRNSSFAAIGSDRYPCSNSRPSSPPLRSMLPRIEYAAADGSRRIPGMEMAPIELNLRKAASTSIALLLQGVAYRGQSLLQIRQ